MPRFSFLMGTLLVGACLTGCGSRLEPKPLDAEQERQFQEELRKTHDQEQAHFQQE